ELGFVNHIKNAIELASLRKGPGVFGAFFGFFFYKIFGTIGTFIVLLFVIVTNIMILTGVKIKEIIAFLKEYRNKLIDKTKESQKKSKSKAKNINNKELAMKNNISINDYNQNREIKDKDIKNESDIVKDINENSIKIHDYLYNTPPLSLLKSPSLKGNSNDKKEILNNAKKIEDTINNFGIGASVSNINKGPTVTCYELLPDPGIKLSRIVSLSDNIALSLATSDIRIEAPIPGKAAVGIEVPNRTKESVYLKEIINSKEYKE